MAEVRAGVSRGHLPAGTSFKPSIELAHGLMIGDMTSNTLDGFFNIDLTVTGACVTCL